MKTSDADMVKQAVSTNWTCIVVNGLLTISAFFLGWKFGLVEEAKPYEPSHFLHLGFIILLWLACLFFTFKALSVNVELIEMYQDSAKSYKDLLDSTLVHMREMLAMMKGKKIKDKAEEEDEKDRAGI